MSTVSEAIDRRANWFYDESDCSETSEQVDMANGEAMLDCTIREWLNHEQILILMQEAKKTGLRPLEMFSLAVAEWIESRKFVCSSSSCS